MSDQHEPPAADPGSAGGSPSVAEVARPGDPAARELAEVEEAMAAVRVGVPAPGGEPTVPDDDEVAALERAHDALRTTLDRVDRGG